MGGRQVTHILVLGLGMASQWAVPSLLFAQKPQPDSLLPLGALEELKLERVLDFQNSIARFLADSLEEPGTARLLLQELLEEPGLGCKPSKTYFWIVFAPPDTAPPGTLSDRIYSSCDDEIVSSDRLYEADRFTTVVILPQGSVSFSAAELDSLVSDSKRWRRGLTPEQRRESSGFAYSVRVGTSIVKETGYVASALPAFLERVLPAFLRFTAQPAIDRGERTLTIRAFDVGLRSSEIDFADAKLSSRIEILVRGSADPTSAASDSAALERRMIDVKINHLPFTMELDSVTRTLQRTLRSENCLGNSSDCFDAAEEALVALAPKLGFTTEFRNRQLQRALDESREAFRQTISQQLLARARNVRVVSRPFVGFSLGAAATNAFAEDVEFEVEDGQIVPAEEDDFAALAFVDLYFRRVDLKDAPGGMLPHVSLGLAIKDELRPGLFAATTLPSPLKRLAVFAGVMPVERVEVESEGQRATASHRKSAVAGGVEPPDATETRSRTRYPFVFGLKITLPP